MLLYMLSQPNPALSKIEPDMAYILVLHDKFNQSFDKLKKITYNDVLDKFNYKYIMIKGDGSVYQANENDHKIIKMLYSVNPTITGGTHFGWEIDTNGTKYYVDSTTGAIVSTFP